MMEKPLTNDEREKIILLADREKPGIRSYLRRAVTILKWLDETEMVDRAHLREMAKLYQSFPHETSFLTRNNESPNERPFDAAESVEFRRREAAGAVEHTMRIDPQNLPTLEGTINDVFGVNHPYRIHVDHGLDDGLLF